MTRLQLARLVDWAGTRLESRKRLQKVVYLLKAAGCPLNVEYTLHHYGPYSHELAELTDDMVRAGLLVEDSVGNQAGGQTFSYQLSEPARSQLETASQDSTGLPDWEEQAKRLLREANLQTLEYGATIVYFQKQGKSWEEARKAAAGFKRQKPESQVMRQAESFAREIVGS